MRALTSLFLAFAVTIVAVSPAGAGPEKVSPLLRKFTHPGLEVAFDHPRTLLVPGLLETAGAGESISCLVQGTMSRAELEALGAVIGTRAGDVYTAVIPANRLLAVSDLPGVVRIEAARKVELTLDAAGNDTNVRTEIHGSAAPPWSGNTGSGVLLGNVDSGIDYTHDDFKDGLGNTRFDRIWDQTVSGTPPTGFGYGSEWSTSAIQTGAATVTNPDGHGTHVLSIAGGDGSAVGAGGAAAYTFVGVAPAATLIHVKTNFTDAGIIDGCDWIFQRATALGIPGVVNLSLGGQYGPHDGTDPFEAALSALTGPGRIIVTSASNDRGVGIHARGTVPDHGQPSALSLQLQVDAYTARPGTQNDLVLFSGWYAGADDYDVTVVSPTGISVTATKGNLQAVATNDGAVQIENGNTTPSNGDSEVFIALFDNVVNRPPRAGTWTITFTRNTSTLSNIDVWMYYSSMGARFTSGVTDDVTIGSPACADEVIAVAAYTTKRTWPSRNGSTYGWNPQPVLLDIADFSGRGPTRTGGQKPDIAAPGFGVVAALSDDVAINSGSIPLILPGDTHWIQAGTSMSSPMVAGLAALLMAKDGPLTPAQVVQKIAQFARTDGFTGAAWNEDWGWGKMNAEAADVLGPSVTVSAPNGGEAYNGGDPLPIAWSATDNFGVDSVDLYYSTDGGATYPHLIATGESNDGSYDWTAPSIQSSAMRVKVVATDTAGNLGEDGSNADFSITSQTAVGDLPLPTTLLLAQNRPNPLRADRGTEFTFALPRDGSARLRIYDTRGGLVATVIEGTFPSGYHQTRWNGRGSDGSPVPSGIYFYRLETENRSLSRKLIVVR